MGQSTILVIGVGVAFLIYIVMKGELPAYLHTVGL